MYRRVELINEYGSSRRNHFAAYKGGLTGFSHVAVVDAWFGKLRGPGKKGIPRNAKFYFTEAGWKEVGRKVVEACQQRGQKYRVIKVKENAVHVVWRDKHTDYEVAAQPKKSKLGG